MFRRLFNPDSDLMIVMTWVTDCIFLSIFWLLACLPVVTVGAATAALYDATYRAYRRHDKHSWQRFWRAFVQNLKGSLLPNILFLAVILGGGTVVIGLWNSAVLGGNWMTFAIGAVIAVMVLGILSVMFPLLSRFESGFGQLLGNTVRLAMANLPRTIALGAVNALMGWLCIRYLLPVFLLPCLTALLSTLLIEPMLKPYLPEDFYEDISIE